MYHEKSIHVWEHWENAIFSEQLLYVISTVYNILRADYNSNIPLFSFTSGIRASRGFLSTVGGS